MKKLLLKLIAAHLERVQARCDDTDRKVDEIMATLDDILADVTAEKTAISGLADLITGLKKQLTDALSGAVLLPAVQAKVDAIFAEAEARKAELAAALAANVPPTP